MVDWKLCGFLYTHTLIETTLWMQTERRFVCTQYIPSLPSQEGHHVPFSHASGVAPCMTMLACPLKYLYQINCHEILYRPSWCPKDESLWLWWCPDFTSNTTIRLTFVVLGERSQPLLDGLSQIYITSERSDFIWLGTPLNSLFRQWSSLGLTTVMLL